MTPDSLRVVFQQTSLPKYRVPIFRRLAQAPGRRFVLRYGSEEPALRNVEPDGFEGRFEPFRLLPEWLGQSFFWHRTQWRIASRREADVAVMCWNARFLSLVPALLRARLAGVPVALWGHGFSKRASRLRSWLRTLPARLATAVVVYDFATADQLVRSGLARERVFVAPNGLDSATIHEARQRALQAPGRDAFRARHGLGSGPVLVFLGRLFEANRLDVAVSALPLLAERFPDIRLAVIGSGEAEVARLKALALSEGVAGRMVWVGPLYDEDALAGWLTAADVFVYPSNVGLSLIHAFNYGLPALVCEPVSAHNPEIAALADGTNGRLAASLSPAALAEAAHDVLADPQRFKAMSEAALETARSTYNLDQMAAGFDRLIAFLASQRRSA